ncbi:MAG: hypothetical protein DMD72_05945 [Gemmatimonadetes bacterium]|nr:MAG: hypothetical protein DMD72_05945 [Gemmatimonadota bacterium]
MIGLMKHLVRVFLAFLFVVCSAVPAVAQRSPPSLIVLITIDQFRADYLDRFAPQLHGGLARLTQRSAWFTNAHHDHAITETAPGHATLLSGRFPRSTGIVANRVGVIDDSAPLVGVPGGNGASPRRFQGTTLVDWLRAKDPRSQTLSVSMKDRAAILPVGRSRSDVYWYFADGHFTTSRYYRDSLPDWVKRFNARNLPHTITDIDETTLALALDGLSALSLGAESRTDLLAISLSATDLIGHGYGPDSQEMADNIVRVDRILGAFLDSLFKLRDSARVAIVLTADHGIGTIPELAKSVTPAPVRLDAGELASGLRSIVAAANIDTNLVDLDQQIVLADRNALRDRTAALDTALALFAKQVRALPGVSRVDRFQDLLKGDTINDPIARRWVHQLPARTNAEMVITLTPLSIFGGLPATHGSPYDYDTHVPLIFYGGWFVPAHYPEFVRTVDLAPTLAAIAGVKPGEKIDGVVLKRALR